MHPQLHELRVIDVSEEYYKADFKIADVANELGPDWVKLAVVLGVPQAQIEDIENELEVADQPLESLVVWTKLKGPLATGASLDVTDSISSCSCPSPCHAHSLCFSVTRSLIPVL